MLRCSFALQSYTVFHIFHFTGDATWTKEEALASIVSVEMADLPVSEIQAKFEEEFGADHGKLFNYFPLVVGSNCKENNNKTWQGMTGLIHLFPLCIIVYSHVY